MSAKRGSRSKANGKPEKPFVQFSKKMVTAILIFWGLIRLWSVVAVWINPAVGEPMVRIIQGVDDIATVLVLAYTGNSISEKIALGYFEMRSGQMKAEESGNEEGNG